MTLTMTLYLLGFGYLVALYALFYFLDGGPR